MNGKLTIRLAAAVAILLFVPAVARAQMPLANSISAVKVGADKRAHITYSDGGKVVAPKEKGQVDCTSLKVAADKFTAGWLVLKPADCCVSYPIPQIVVVYRERKIVRRIEGQPLIWNWQFFGADNEVALSIGPQHGENGVHFELHDLQGGRLVTTWDEHSKQEEPAWVSGLENR
jgi:hypothetical protein